MILDKCFLFKGCNSVKWFYFLNLTDLFYYWGCIYEVLLRTFQNIHIFIKYLVYCDVVQIFVQYYFEGNPNTNPTANQPTNQPTISCLVCIQTLHVTYKQQTPMYPKNRSETII